MLRQLSVLYSQPGDSHQKTVIIGKLEHQHQSQKRNLTRYKEQDFNPVDWWIHPFTNVPVALEIIVHKIAT